MEAGLIPLDRELRAASTINDGEESALGDELEREFAAHPPFQNRLDRTEDVERYLPYVRECLAILAEHSTRPLLRLRPHILRDDTLNAMAMVGGVVIVYTGLFSGPNRLQSEAELLFVLAHEVAHVELRHPLAAREYAKRLGAQEPAVERALRAARMPLSPTEELAADRRALALVVSAQYNPAAPVAVWDRNPGQTTPTGVVAELAGLLRTHPTRASRSCALWERIPGAVSAQPFDRYYDGTTNLHALRTGRAQPH